MPLLELDDGRCLSESNAIVTFLAEGSALMPTDAFARAKVQQWQFFEQYSHEPFIAVTRFIKRYLGMPEARRAEFEGKQVCDFGTSGLRDFVDTHSRMHRGHVLVQIGWGATKVWPLKSLRVSFRTQGDTGPAQSTGSRPLKGQAWPRRARVAASPPCSRKHRDNYAVQRRRRR